MAQTSKERLEYIYNWIKKNPEKFKATQKRCREKHKDQKREKERLKYPEIKDRKNEQRRNRRRSKPGFSGNIWVCTEKLKLENPDEFKRIKKEKSQKSYLKRRDHQLNKMHDRIVNLRLETLYWYSYGIMRCSECGEKNIEFLAIDHINNDGSEDRLQHRGNLIEYLWKARFPEGYQVLCHNCNALKQFETYSRKTPSAAYHRYHDRLKIAMVKKYSGGSSRCVCCGEERLRCLTFHHVHGGGTKHVKSLKNKSLPGFLYKNSPPLSDFSVLCFNCNKSVGHYGYCPHGKMELLPS